MGIYKLNIYCTVKRLNFYQSFNFYSSNALRTYSTINTNSKVKKKVVAVRKSFPADGTNSPTALQTKDASSVMKSLNFEFRSLYGPLLEPKTQPRKTNDYDLNRSTKYQVKNLISKQNSNLEPNESALDISDFPLMNQVPRILTEVVFISKANSLRENLLQRCGSNTPSVSRILEKTMPEESAERLRQWKLKMIKELGEEGFKKYHQELLDKGSSLHSSINSYLSFPQDVVRVEKRNAEHWKSLKTVFPLIKNVRLLEERISHPFLCYQGIVDCFAEYKNHLVVVDWKTSKNSKTSLANTYDNPLQIAAYVGALNYDTRLQYLVDKGLIVVAYENGSPATELFINKHQMLQYWAQWLERVKKYWEMMEIAKTKD